MPSYCCVWSWVWVQSTPAESVGQSIIRILLFSSNLSRYDLTNISSTLCGYWTLFSKIFNFREKTHTLLESSIRVTPQIVKGTFLHRMLSYLEWIWPGSTLSNQDPFSFNPSLLSLSVEARVGGQLKCLGLFSLTLLLHFVRLLDSSPLGSQHKYTLSQLLGCNFANEPWCN